MPEQITTRVPLALAATGRTVAAFSTSTPGLYVNWSRERRTYCISSQDGSIVATGWATAAPAVACAAELLGVTDWTALNRDNSDEVSFRAICQAGQTVQRHGGAIHADVPGSLNFTRYVGLLDEHSQAFAREGDLEERIEQIRCIGELYAQAYRLQASAHNGEPVTLPADAARALADWMALEADVMSQRSVLDGPDYVTDLGGDHAVSFAYALGGAAR